MEVERISPMSQNELNSCPFKPDIQELAGAVKVLVEKTDTLIQLNRDIIKWLLVVVCIIALGRSAFDVTKDLLHGTISPVRAEQLKQ